MDNNGTILKLLACICFGGATAFFVVMLYRLTQIGKRRGYRLYRNLDAPGRHAPQGDGLLRIIPFRAALAACTVHAGKRLGLEPLLNYIRVPYARAGYPGGLEDEEVVALGFFVGIAITIFLAYSIALLLGTSLIWLALFGMPLGLMVLVANLKSRANARELRILQALPYVLDLLVLILRSGTSLSIAMIRVVEDYQDHPVGEELGQVLAEMEMGAPRVESFRRFAARVAIPDITSLSDAIVQSEELGWPLAETLEHLADRLASERVLRAQAKAGAAGVLVMLPSTLVLMSAVLLLFGPLILRYWSSRNGF